MSERDIVERLRRMSDMSTTENDLLDIGRAADKISTLRARVAELEGALRKISDEYPHPSRFRAGNIARAVLNAPANAGATFEAGPDECDTGVALTKAINAVLAEDAEAPANPKEVMPNPMAQSGNPESSAARRPDKTAPRPAQSPDGMRAAPTIDSVPSCGSENDYRNAQPQPAQSPAGADACPCCGAVGPHCCNHTMETGIGR